MASLAAESVVSLSNADLAERFAAEYRGIVAAAAAGHAAVLECFLGDSRIDAAGRTYALFAACEHGQLSVVERLLADPLVDPGAAHPKAAASAVCEDGRRRYFRDVYDPYETLRSTKSQRFSDEALRLAAAGGHLAVVERLLADPRVSPVSSMSSLPFEAAVLRAHVDVARRLLADPRLRLGCFADEALSIAAAQGNVPLLDLLLTDGRFDPTPFHRDERCDTVWKQLEHGGRVAEPEQSLIAIAAGRGHLQAVERLLADSRVDASACDNLALSAAVKGRHPAVVERLLADPRVRMIKPESRASILAAAASLGREDIVDAMLADEELLLPDKGCAAARAAAASGQLHTLMLLLAHPHVDAERAIQSVVACAADGNLAAVELLVREYGIDPAGDSEKAGATLISAASTGLHFGVMRWLLADERAAEWHEEHALMTRAVRAAAQAGDAAFLNEVLDHPVSAAADAAARRRRRCPCCAYDNSLVAVALLEAAICGNPSLVQQLLSDPRLAPAESSAEVGRSGARDADVHPNYIVMIAIAAEHERFGVVDTLLADARVRRQCIAKARLSKLESAPQVFRLLEEAGEEQRAAMLAESSESQVGPLLGLACRFGHMALLQRLLELPQSVIQPKMITAAAEHASKAGSVECMQLLLDHPRACLGDVLPRAIKRAAAMHHTPLLRALLDDPRLTLRSTFDPDSELRVSKLWLAERRQAVKAALVCAAQRGDVPLLSRIAGDPLLADNAPEALAEAAVQAATFGRLAALDVLLADRRIDSRLKPETGLTCGLFFKTARMSEPWSGAVMRRLLALPNERADPMLDEGEDKNVLELAASCGIASCVEALLADPRIRAELADVPCQRAPLACAAQEGHLDIVELLLADPLIDPTAKALYRTEGPPLEEAAIGGCTSIIDRLLTDARVDPAAANADNGTQPLQWAACSGAVSAVKRLLADPRVFAGHRDGNGIDALEAAIGHAPELYTMHRDSLKVRIDGDRLGACRRLLLETDLLHARLRTEARLPDVRRLGVDVAGLGQRAWLRRRAVVLARQLELDGTDADE